MKKIIIGGDLAPIKKDAEYFSMGEIEKVIDRELLEFIAENDYRVFDIEFPISDIGTPIPKTGPNKRCIEAVMAGINRMNINLVTLANNHIMDFGIGGALRTKELLNKNHIDCIGLVGNRYSTETYKVIEVEGKRIAFYACAENEFSTASDEQIGANPLEIMKNSKDITMLKENADFVVVLLHGGVQYYPYVEPYLKKISHEFIDAGADLVLCQHGHCLGSLEYYKDRAILYGQGNFLLDIKENEISLEGCMVQICVDEEISVDFFPIRRVNNMVCLVEKRKNIIDEMCRRANENSFERFYEYSEKVIQNYIYDILRIPLVIRWIDKRCKYFFIRKVVSCKQLLILQNIARDEAHREIVIAGTKRLLEKRK